MSSTLNFYTHPVFGNLRTIIDDGTIHLCAEDAVTALPHATAPDVSER